MNQPTVSLGQTQGFNDCLDLFRCFLMAVWSFSQVGSVPTGRQWMLGQQQNAVDWKIQNGEMVSSVFWRPMSRRGRDLMQCNLTRMCDVEMAARASRHMGRPRLMDHGATCRMRSSALKGRKKGSLSLLLLSRIAATSDTALGRPVSGSRFSKESVLRRVVRATATGACIGVAALRSTHHWRRGNDVREAIYILLPASHLPEFAHREPTVLQTQLPRRVARRVVCLVFQGPRQGLEVAFPKYCPKEYTIPGVCICSPVQCIA
ncbi:hypothetical protein BJ166DRAFT_378425 [Pestalotiopsis sp. NC0098]|nr:hypothetical protein BJ166DRAFT_378425 [Pestalotiopsis sp. NC0098]